LFKREGDKLDDGFLKIFEDNDGSIESGDAASAFRKCLIVASAALEQLNAPNLIRRIFRAIYVFKRDSVNKTCDKCNCIFVEPEILFRVPIENKEMKEALSNMFFSNKLEQIQCVGHNELVNTNKSNFIRYLPNILCFELFRTKNIPNPAYSTYIENNSTLKDGKKVLNEAARKNLPTKYLTIKTNDYFSFPINNEELDMFPYTEEYFMSNKTKTDCEKERFKGYYNYILVGVLIHTSTDNLYGHYTSLARERHYHLTFENVYDTVFGPWYHISDEVLINYFQTIEPDFAKERLFGGVIKNIDANVAHEFRNVRDGDKYNNNARMLIYERVKWAEIYADKERNSIKNSPKLIPPDFHIIPYK
jgi:hypothetical protein